MSPEPTAKSTNGATAPRRRAGAAWRPAPEWLPQQHGAWAMLAVPAVVGAVRSGPTPLHLLLVALLLAGYFAFNAATLALRAGRWTRYRTPLLVYGGLTAALGLAALAARPALLGWIVVYLPLALISFAFARQRADRSLGNDAVTILAAALFVAVMAGVGVSGDVSGQAWIVVVVFAYFFGTALYVKTVIRERTNPRYHVVSIGYHAAWTLFWAVSGSIGVPVSLPTRIALVAYFAVLTLRARLMAGRRVRPVVVGLGEIVASLGILVLTITW